MLGKIEFYWFFHGLIISEKNINKNNIKWFIRSCSLICRSSVDLCFDWNFLCFVSLYFPTSCLVLVPYNDTNIPCFLCLISKLFALGNIILNSAPRRWISITSGEWFLILNKKAWNICLLLLSLWSQHTVKLYWKILLKSSHNQ